jgi:hypothetical protein
MSAPPRMVQQPRSQKAAHPGPGSNETRAPARWLLSAPCSTPGATRCREDSTVTDLNELSPGVPQRAPTLRAGRLPELRVLRRSAVDEMGRHPDLRRHLNDDGTEQTTDNRIGPFIRTEIARMTKTRPKWVGVPKSQTDQDIAGARYAEQALDDAWKRHNLLRKLRAALLWSRITGAGFWKVWWDPSVGPKKDVLVYGVRPREGRASSSATSTWRPWRPRESSRRKAGQVSSAVRRDGRHLRRDPRVLSPLPRPPRRRGRTRQRGVGDRRGGLQPRLLQAPLPRAVTTS